MIGGIYCEIPLGTFYDKSKANSVRWRLNKLVGVNTRFLNPIVIDWYIYQTLDKIVRKYYSQRRALGYHDSPEHTLKNSYAYAIYDMNGYPRLKIYSKAPFVEAKGEFVDEFIETYEPITKSGWMVLLCATAPYAARVESSGMYSEKPFFKGYDKTVLASMVNGISQRIKEACGRKGSDLKYGYILNSKIHGTVGEPLPIKN